MNVYTAPGRTANHSAFTLIETMLSLVIITMIATLVVPSLLSLRGDATTDRAKAEIASALSDARSLARARSMPVVVSIAAPDSQGESEIACTVVTEASNIAGALADPGEEPPESLPENLPESVPDVQTRSDPQPPAASPNTTRRLGILPRGCTLAHAVKTDSTTSTATPASTRASTMLAVIFPDGTASVPRRPLELTISAPRTTPRVFNVRLSSWFAEATFTESLPAAEAAPAETTLTDAEAGTDPAADPTADEVTR